MDKRTIYISILLASSLILLGCSNDNNDDDKDPKKKVLNFEDCIDAKGEIAESYPRQCTYNGETFVEDISTPVSTSTVTGDTTSSSETPQMQYEEIEVTGTVADLGDLLCKCFTLKTNNGDYSVRYDDFLPEQSDTGPVDVSDIKNGDEVNISGDLEISEKSSVRNVMLKEIEQK